MKHNLKITLLFVLLFLLANVVGLSLVKLSTNQITELNGTIQINYTSTIIGERAELNQYEQIIYIVVGIAIGTSILLFLAKRKKKNWWKTWFLMAATISMGVAFGVLVKEEYYFFVWVFAFVLAYLKIYKPNLYVQNITEIFMYAGIAVLFVPVLELNMMIIILILISLYDMYAVWKSKHMVVMANFTADADVFPGLAIQYKSKGEKTKLITKTTKQAHKISNSKVGGVKTGILGGGDIVFPMLFAGSVMTNLISQKIPLNLAFNYSLIVVAGAAIALTGLFILGKNNRFYPAMPFISTGCFLGYVIMLLLL
ncbi:hypothetical protein K9L67_05110 [Candidatus Woesearchaeota archaeon]|nr:hypothetical protein [Candidatus Woesearchaeota archaeon]MCF7901577.1 hypothetical protein [Candidatus Woesearchaeota archaeon]MCF8013981.1 hypothetical protein [Candidatus Woesearchaeota archaeon]